MSKRIALNAAAFYAVWWVSLAGAARGAPWVGPIAVLLFAAVVLATSATSAVRRGRLALLGIAAVMGYATDSALVWYGVLTFPPHAVLGWPSTLWMVGLWVNLALTLDASLGWLRRRYALAAAAGAVCGPLAYAAGERLGAAALGPSFGAAMLMVAVEWVVAMPLLLLVAEWTVFAAEEQEVPSAASAE